MKITIRLADLLTKDKELQGSINLAMHDFQIWFEDRNLVFFPEYTDHGPKHIEEVMTTAEALITDESWRLLTPEDAAVLILSIILHDCAMHLSEEGFVALVNPASPRSISADFKDKPWPELWANFLSEASRFDARKLRAIFGDTEPIHRPPLDARDMTLRDRLLIGEFLRRHHPRLAHEIALWGIPGPGIDRIGLVRLPKGLDNIAGLCARSHGLSLRESLEVIPKDQRREYLKVHVPFLMSALRTADYLQIHSERAPRQILKVRSLKSPVSQGEWKAHDAVEDIHCTHDDPEAIVVIAKPKDVRTFLKLKRLLSGLQEELDASWAVLGEVYGRIQGLRDLGLTIRRVRSNLDDTAEFSRTVSYYPDKVIFEADPEILKLLIDPLYGDTPSIAIRELIQNAVDACLELDDYMKEVSSEQTAKPLPAKASVTVHLEEDEDKGGWLTVSDNGIGMTPSVVKNYFLKAGASFRRSEAWKELHETSAGKSRVLRSGRFGIGILAAFLLGDRLEVKTRHITSSPDKGIQFTCSIEDEEIELQRAIISTVGTTIRIRLSDETFYKLYEKESEWEWYYLKKPSLEREVTEQFDGEKETRTLKPTYLIPMAHSHLPLGWHRIRHEDFEDIHWHYPLKGERQEYEDKLFCNGIKIGGWSAYDSKIGKEFRWPFSLEAPVLSVFDPDGKLPLNLERSELTRSLPFEHELLEDVCRDLIAYLLINTPSRPLLNSESTKFYKEISYPGMQRRYYRAPSNDWFWFTPEGLSLSTKWFLQGVSPQNLYIFPHITSLQFDIPREYANAHFSDIDLNFGSFDPWVRFVLTGTGSSYWYGDRHWLYDVNTYGRRIMLSTEYESRIKTHKAIPKSFLANIVEEWRNDDWIVLCTVDCPEPSVEFQRFAKKARPNIFNALGEWYIESVPLEEEEESVIEQVWRDIVEDPLIPFSPNTRKEQLAKAFEKLGYHINSYRANIRRR
jgi:hypothetical protein